MKKYLTLGVLAALLSIAMATAFGSPTASGSSSVGGRFFDTNCAVLNNGGGENQRIDPLVSPGSNMTMPHDLLGNNSLNANSTGASLAAANATGSASTCGPAGTPPYMVKNGACAAYDAAGFCPAFREGDGAAYWVAFPVDCGTVNPIIQFGTATPTLAQCQSAPNSIGILHVQGATKSGMHVYYWDRQDPAYLGGKNVEPFPVGFGEVKGYQAQNNVAGGLPCTPDTASDPQAASDGPNGTCQHEWRCGSETATSPTYVSIDNGGEQGSYEVGQNYDPSKGFLCPAGNNGGAQVELTVHMASCWDGTVPSIPINPLNQPNVAYQVPGATRGSNAVCPAGFTHLLPQADEQIYFTIKPDNLPHFYLLTGSMTNGPDGTPVLTSTSKGHGDMFQAWDTNGADSNGSLTEPVPGGSMSVNSGDILQYLVSACFNTANSGSVPGCNVSP